MKKDIQNRMLLSGVLLVHFIMVAAVVFAIPPVQFHKTVYGIQNAISSYDKKQNADWVAPMKDQGTLTVYRGKDLKLIAMPVGGILAGQLYFNGDGSLGRWDIMNARSLGNSPVLRQFPDRERMLQQGFSLRVQEGGKVRSLPLELKTFPQTTFTPEFPAGIVRYAGAAGLPMDVTLEGIAPFVPLDAKTSGIPATFLRITLKNTGTTELKGDLLGWLENGAAAHSGTPGEGFRTAATRELPGALAIEFTAKSSGQSETKKTLPTVLLADFESTDYMGWKPSGEAFGTRPTLLNEFAKAELSEALQNSSGTACAGSATGGPKAVGVLESPEFRIERDMLRFNTAWGRDEKKLRVELYMDGKVVHSSTGSGGPNFKTTQWDVREFKGKTARLVVTDESEKSYTLVDQVELADSDLGPLEKRPDFGGMALVLLDPKPDASAEPSVIGNATSGFQKGAAKVPFGESQIGVITAPWILRPGETQTLTFAVAWHFPNLELMDWGKLQGNGRWYASRLTGLPAVTDELAANGLNILQQTDLWRSTWYDSTLPRWVLDRVMANAATLATNTCYRFKDGRFYGFEGVHSFIGTCNHVWHYDETIGRLFPELEMSLRTQADFVPGVGIKSDGSIPMRIDGQPGSLDPLPKQPILFGTGYQHWASIDGQCGIILRSYRSHLTSSDDSFVKAYWPRIKSATQWLFRQDTDGDDLPDAVTHHTLDEDIAGRSPWISSLWLAAVEAAEKMAMVAGDPAFAVECQERVAKGKKSFMEKLWKGDRFVHIAPQSEKWRPGSYDGVHIDQILGQQWAWRAGLERVVPEKETRIALENIYRHNFKEDVGPYYAEDPANKPSREFAAAGEAGTIMATFPERSYRPDGKVPGHEWNSGNRFHQGFYNETMTGFEHAFASHLIYEGLVDEGLRVFRAVHDRHQPSSAKPRNPFNEPEAGQHYSRAMASYAVFLALSGFEYNGPVGKISFAPRIGADNFKAAFSAAEGWGSYSQKWSRGAMTVTVSLKHGRLAIKTLGLALSADAIPSHVKALLGGQPVPVKLTLQSGQAQVVFDQGFTLSAGQSLVVNVATTSAPVAKGDGSIEVPSGSTDAEAVYETAGGKPETKAEHDARMAWWREARYGLFIHWSLSSVYAGEWKGKPSGGDWLMNAEKATVAEYAEGAKRFTAENFNADEWVALAKAGGMKYVVITAKHHDGFTMFPSKASPFNIRDATPFKRDPIAELAAACRREGLKFGLYYSQAQDWHHAGGYKPTIKWRPGGIGSEPGVSWDPAQDGDPIAYVKNVAAVHVREIVENYKPDVLWWDYPTIMPEESVKALRAPLADLPNVIVNSRLGNGVKGDFATFEFSIPEEKTIGRDWETCTNMNKSWGYRRLDLAYRPVSDLLRELIEIMSRGGNYLLNIGPDSKGKIPEPQIERITQIGKWLKQNAEFVYGTSAVKIGWQPKNQWLVSKNGDYYLHLTAWGNQAARLPGLSTGIVSATTTTGESLAVGKDGEGITTIAPPAHPDPLGTIVVLKLVGPLETKPSFAECLPREDGSYVLSAMDAAMPPKVRIGYVNSKPVLRGWESTSQISAWKLMVPAEGAGDYTVNLSYSCEDADAGSKFEMVTGESKLSGSVQSTGDMKVLQLIEIPGVLRLKAGPQMLSIVPLSVAKGSVMNLCDITLTPVKKNLTNVKD